MLHITCSKCCASFQGTSCCCMLLPSSFPCSFTAWQCICCTTSDTPIGHSSLCLAMLSLFAVCSGRVCVLYQEEANAQFDSLLIYVLTALLLLMSAFMASIPFIPAHLADHKVACRCVTKSANCRCMQFATDGAKYRRNCTCRTYCIGLLLYVCS